MGMVMTQEDKDLLLRDLCARIPYNVKGCLVDECGAIPNDPYLRNISLTFISLVAVDGRDGRVLRGEVKPYLLPLSSMTEEQKNDCPINETNLNIIKSNIGYGIIEMPWRLSYLFVDWCNKNHFDYRGLIPMGLALDATGLNIY